MSFQSSRRERRILASENRAQPPVLARVPDTEWAHIKNAGEDRTEVWRSRYFLVQIFAEKNGVERLTVCRTTVDGSDWAADISWDELQRLKHECAVLWRKRHKAETRNFIARNGCPVKASTALACASRRPLSGWQPWLRMRRD